MAGYEDLKSATEGWYCRPLPAPMVTSVLPRGELEPFLELTSDIGANENPLVHYIDFITGHRDPVPPELDEQYKAAWKDDNYHNLPPPDALALFFLFFWFFIACFGFGALE